MRNGLRLSMVSLALLGSLPSVSAEAAITATTYPFASGAASLEDMSAGTTQLIGADQSGARSPVTPLGFVFRLDGVSHSQFSVSSEGFLRLGSTQVTFSSDNAAAFASTSDAPKICPYFDDLRIGTNGKVHYKVVGSAPLRKLVVEWLNMQIPPVGGGNPGAGTFQVWLSESTGMITFVYGTGISANSANGGYTVGFQSGAATNFASVTTNGPFVFYGMANNTQTDAIPGGVAYTFTPPVPADPTALHFTSTTPVSTTVNWTDNATNEIAYVLYRSTDGGATYAFVNELPSGSTSHPDSGLTPGATVHYRVYAATEGALSTNPATGSVTMPSAGAVASNAGSFAWSDPAAWVGGAVPTAGDQVTIAAGSTILIDTNAAAAYTVTVAGTGLLQYHATTVGGLDVGADVTIQSGGTFRTNPTGGTTGHQLAVGGNLTNNGTLDFWTGPVVPGGVTITFDTEGTATFSGTGTTQVYQVTMNKGSSTASSLTLSPASFTSSGLTGNAAWLTTPVQNGLLRISGTFAMSSTTFTANWTIGATAGVWLDNPSYTVTGINGSPTLSGVLRVSQGTFNVGNASGNSLAIGSGGVVTIEGGILNVAGRLHTAFPVTYNQSGGVVNVSVVGHASSSASFGLTSQASVFNMTGGKIVLVQASTAPAPLDYWVEGSAPPTGGTLQIGSPATATNFLFRIRGNVPNLLFDTSGTPKSVALSGVFAATTAASFWLGDITIPLGSSLDLNGWILDVIGGSIINNDAILGAVPGSRLYFKGTAPQTYSGTGYCGSPGSPLDGFGVDNPAGLTLSASVITLRVNLFRGPITNANLITLGGGGATGATVQVSRADSMVNGGSFDVPPSWNIGTAGQNLYLLAEPTQRILDHEVNPSHDLNSLILDNTSSVELTGGGVTVVGMTLTNGRLITGPNVVAVIGSVTRTNGYVDGSLLKPFGAAGSKTFEVGTANGYTPVTVNATAGTFPRNVQVKAVQAPVPGYTPAPYALNRYFSITAPGITADLTFRYLDTDIPGMVTEADLHLFRKASSTFTDMVGILDTAQNTVDVTGVAMATFSDWALAMPGPTAAVSGDATICEGSSTTLQAALTGTSPWSLTWSDGFVQNAVAASPATRVVSPGSSTVYSVTTVSDAAGSGTASGSANVTVTPDNVPPIVTPPATEIEIYQSTCCGASGAGITGATSTEFATFLSSATATDDCVASPNPLPTRSGAVEITPTSCLYTTTGSWSLTFYFEDGAGNVGSAGALVKVRGFGDLNFDDIVDPSDFVILRDYLNFVMSPGVPPFAAQVGAADVNHDGTVDPGDFVTLRDYLNFIVTCLAP